MRDDGTDCFRWWLFGTPPPVAFGPCNMPRTARPEFAMDDSEKQFSDIDTAWSVVIRAHGDQDAARAAQQALLDRYGGAVRRYALAALRDEDAADEVYQEFALRLMSGRLADADPERGHFRAFVKSIVYRLIVDHQRRMKKQQRVSPIQSNVADPSTDDEYLMSADAVFQTSWRQDLMNSCWKTLADQEANAGQPHYTVLLCNVDHPDARSPQLAEIVSQKLVKPVNAGSVRVLLHRARAAFAELLLAEVMRSIENGSLDDAEQELIELDLLKYCRPALERRRAKK
jgi:RNA polymerase sigma factor (sigma-70 family)